MVRDEFLGGMRLAATGVSIVTTRTPQGWAGVTVSAVCSVSADPPSLLVCVHHLSRVAEAVVASGVFCVNLLSEAQQDLSELFAGRAAAPGGDRFAAASWRPRQSGAPALVGALVAFDCSLVRELRWGSHHVLIGDVLEVARCDGRPLVYCDRSYGRVSLEPAPNAA
jgi:flavin reductase